MQNVSQKKIDDLQNNVMSNCVNVKKKEFKSGEYILSFGLRQKMIGLVSKGKADIIRIDIDGNESVIKKLTPGSIFNDAFSCYSTNSVFVISRTDTEIFFIDYPQVLTNCLMHCPYHNQMVQLILELFTENSIALNEKIEILSYPKIRDRILAFITLGIGDEGTNTYKLPFSLTELAEFLCVDRSALMRELKKMEKEKIIERNNKTITLLNVSHY